MCGSLFWGLLILLFGVSIIINALFGINLPLVKMFFAGCLIYWGISILMPSQRSACKMYAFEESFEQEKYKVLFGSSTIDLNVLKNLSVPKTIKIAAQCANVVVLLPHDVPVHVKADISFATVHLPGQRMSSEYTNLHGASEPLLTVLIDGAFSNVIVKE